MKRPQKITLGQMREMGVRGVLVYCSDYRCSHWGRIISDRWPDDVRLSDLEPLFVCQACGTRPADLGPNFHWEKEQRPVKSQAQGRLRLCRPSTDEWKLPPGVRI